MDRTLGGNFDPLLLKGQDFKKIGLKTWVLCHLNFRAGISIVNKPTWVFFQADIFFGWKKQAFMNEIQMKRSYKPKATIKVVSAVTEHSLCVYPCISYCFLFWTGFFFKLWNTQYFFGGTFKSLRTQVQRLTFLE